MKLSDIRAHLIPEFDPCHVVRCPRQREKTAHPVRHVGSTDDRVHNFLCLTLFRSSEGVCQPLHLKVTQELPSPPRRVSSGMESPAPESPIRTSKNEHGPR